MNPWIIDWPGLPVGGSLYLRPNYGDVDIPIHLPEGSIVVKVTVRGD